jgi:CheY-like chemotaxis protein
MSTHYRCAITLLAVFAVLLPTANAMAQVKPSTRPPKKTTPPPKPAAEKKVVPAAKPLPKHDAPADVPVKHADNPPPPPPVVAPAKAKAADEPSAPSQELLDANPAIRSALEMPRKEPRDYVQAILLLIDLGHPELAKPILADLSKLEVADAQRVAIVGEFGSQGMLHMSQAKELAPDAATFANACMAAASAAANNPERIAALIKQISDPSPEARVAARNDLAATGQAGVTATLETLAVETNPERRAALVAALELMHPLVDRPLLAMLETRDANLRSSVTTILAHLAVPQAAPFLVADPAAAERALVTALSNYQHGTPPFAVDEANEVELWKWDDTTKKLTSMRLPADEAQLIWIARVADELARVRPDSPDDQRRALVLRLESAGLNSKGKAQTPKSLALADPQILSQALADALKKNYSHAALALVEALASRADIGVLMTADGKPSPLADALNSPNRRVRFAALKTIMALNPATPYPGSSRVPDALSWFAGGTRESQALVAMPTNAVAGDLAGQLAAHQLVAQATNRAHEAVEMARSMPNLALILIDMNILGPDAREAVYELRTNAATGDVPIAVLAADGRLEAAKRLAADHTRVIAVPRPHTADALSSIVSELEKLAARDPVSAEERVAEAEQAQKWLAMLSSGNRPFYTFRRVASRPSTPASIQATVPLAAPPAAGPAAVAPADESIPNP